MVTNTAKLQEKIMALTNIDGSGGIDILTNSGDFKSTYEILLAISKVWDKMDDVDQAALLEIVAGKTRGSVVAALFQNGDVLEKAYESASDASGSAIRELENHLDSIQGRIDLFNNALQTMWMNFINDDVIKFIVDIGTGLMKLIDFINPLNVAVTGLFGGLFAKYKMKQKNTDILSLLFGTVPKKIKNGATAIFDAQMGNLFSKDIAKLVSSGVTDYEKYAKAIKGVSAAKQIEILTNNGVAESEQLLILTKTLGSEAAAKQAIANAQLATSHTAVSASMVGELVNTGALTAEQGAAAISAMGLVTAEGEATAVTKVAALAKLDDAVATGILSAADKDAIISTLGLGTSNIATTGTFVTLTKSIWGAIVALTKFLFLTPAGWAILAVSAIAGAIAAYNAFGPTHENFIEKLEEETETLKSVQSELQNVQSELEKTQERMDELNTKGTLSFVEEEELNRLKQQTAELERQEAILQAQEKRARNKQINAALNAAKSDPNLKDNTAVTKSYAELQNQGPTSTNTATPYAASLQNKDVALEQTSYGNKYDINLKKLKEAREEWEKYEAQLVEIGDAESKEYQDTEEKAEAAKKRVEECNATLDSMNESWQKEYGEIGYVENATTEEEKAWNEYYRQHQDYLDQQALINNDYGKDVVLDRIFGATGTDVAKKFKKEFERAVKYGQDPTEVIDGMLANADYSNAFSGLEEQFGITIDNIKDYFTQEGEFFIDPVFDIAKYSHDIKSHSAVISEFQDAIQSLEKGSFTMDDFLDLIERFPDLAKGVDISSKSFYGLSRNLNKAIKSRTKSFINDLKALRKSLVDAGKETDSIDQLIIAIENMPDDALDDIIERYSTLSDEIDKARTAQDRLLASMEENPNQGYESRGDAMEYMKEAMKNGEIGSESNLWNVAERYGFTSDEEDLNKRADALAKFIAIREKWFAQNDDGDERTDDGYSYKGTESFIEAVESASQSVEFYEALKKSLGKDSLDGSEFKWLYDENTGTFDFDFNNENWSAIIEALSQTEELAGLTSEEFSDMMVQVGQFFNINWGDAKDISDHITKIAEGSGTASDKIEQMTDSVESYIKRALGEDLDLSNLTEESIDALETNDNSVKELLKTYLTLKQTLESSLEADPLGLNSQSASIKTVISALGDLGVTYEITKGTLSEPVIVNITSTDLITELREKGWSDEKISAYLQTLSDSAKTLGITIDGKIRMNQDEIDAAIAKSKEIPEKEVTTYNVDGSGTTVVAQIKDDWGWITEDKSTTYTVHQKTTQETEVIGSVRSPLNSAFSNKYSQAVRVDGTANADGSWGAPRTETALTGELGPEILVRNGRWTTVGENGAEFTQVKKGDIIFNHKQSEQLLKNGYVTGRGKLHGGAFASGTAFADGGGTFSRYEFSGDGGYVEYDVNGNVVDTFGDFNAALADAADSVGEFEETIDWIAIRMEEYDETIGKLSAELENLATVAEKNIKIDEIIAENQKKYSDALVGAAYYEEYAQKYLAGMNDDLVRAAKNGAMAITDFTKEQDEATVNAINNYRDYAQKAADLYQQAEEILTDIRNSVIQKIDNIQSFGDAKTAIEDIQTEKLQNRVDLDEAMGEITSPAYYEAMMENSGKKIEYWKPLLENMQKEFDKAVEDGQIKVGSIEWYEQLAKLYEVQAEIDAATIELEEFQNSINDIYWDNFDQLINRIEYLKDETQSLIDLMGNEDMVITPETEGGWTADDVKWTDEGLASLGLYAQQMEIAEFEARQYAEAIDQLTADYEAGKYSENEYLEKLNELKSAQHDAIDAYNDSKEAIVDLNEARIDAIKEGIEKEIDAYSELIEKQKEALDAEKD